MIINQHRTNGRKNFGTHVREARDAFDDGHDAGFDTAFDAGFDAGLDADFAAWNDEGFDAGFNAWDDGADADGGPGVGEDGIEVSQLDRLRDFFRSQIGPERRFATAREMAEVLNLPQSRSTVLYKFLKGAEPRAGIVLEWLEKLGISVLLPDITHVPGGTPQKVEFLPVMNCRAGAGEYLPSSPEDGEYRAFRAFDSEYFRRMNVNPGKCCFLDVQGDSMEPLFSNGSSLLVDMSEEARRYLIDGKIYVVRYEEGVLVKRIHLTPSEIVLLSENPLHAPVRIDNPEAFEVIGRVRWYSVNA